MSAQTVIRILCTKQGYELILGLVPDEVGILENDSEWDGIVIQPQEMVIGSEDHENKTQATEEMEVPYAEPVNDHTEDNSDSLTFFND